jgi:hypothetical protein
VRGVCACVCVCLSGNVVHDFQARPQNCEKRQLASSCPSVCLSVCLFTCLSLRMEKFGSHWTDFDET